MKKLFYFSAMALAVSLFIYSCEKEDIKVEDQKLHQKDDSINAKSSNTSNSHDYAGEIHNIVLAEIGESNGYNNSSIQAKSRMLIRIVERELKKRNIPINYDDSNSNPTFVKSKSMKDFTQILEVLLQQISDSDFDPIALYLDYTSQFKEVLLSQRAVISPDFDSYANQIINVMSSNKFDTKGKLLDEYNRISDEIMSNTNIRGVQEEFLLGSVSVAYHSTDYWISDDDWIDLDDIVQPACGWCQKLKVIGADIGGFAAGFWGTIGANEIWDAGWNPFPAAIAGSGAASDAAR